MTKALTEGAVDRSSAENDSHPDIPMSKSPQNEPTQTEGSLAKIGNGSPAEEPGSTFKKALVWKEKVGFGTKLSSAKWEKRLLVMDGRYLAYFDIEANGEGSEMLSPWKDKGGREESSLCSTPPPSATGTEAKTKKGSSSVIAMLAERKNIQRMKAAAAEYKSTAKSTAKEMKDKAEKKAAYIKDKAARTSAEFASKAASKKQLMPKDAKSIIPSKTHGPLPAKNSKLSNESETTTLSRRSSSSLSETCPDNHVFGPRAYIDMVHDEVSITPSGTQHSSPPTPFVVTIHFKHDDYSAMVNKWKWRICFQTHQDQLEWVFQINLLVTQAAIADCTFKQQHHDDKYLTQYFGFDSHEVSNAAVNTDTVFHAVEHVDLTFSSLTKDDKLVKTPRRRLSVAYSSSFAATRLQAPHMDSVPLTTDSAVPGAGTVQMLGTLLMTANGALLAYGVWSGMLLICVACGFNVVAVSFLVAKIKIICLDLKLDKEKMKLVHEASHRMFKAGRDGTEEKLAKSRDLQSSVHEDEDDVSSIDGSVVDMAASMRIPPMPSAGASTIRLKEGMEATDNTNADGVRLPAWRSISASELKTRALGYLEHHQKRSSPETLYECVAVDVLESAARIREVARRVRLPSSEGLDDNPWHSPEHFIVSIAIPAEAKMGLSSSDDGLGFTIIIYSVMKPETREILARISKLDFDPSDESQWATKEMAERVNAVRLFEKWCQKSPDDPSFQARFKMVPDAINLADLGLPSWIVKYKDKPILIKRSGITGTVYKSDRSLEFHVNFHAFPYLAKQAFAYLREAYFKLIIANAGFVIEGRDDDELPEAIISCVQLCNPDPATAVQAVDFFKGTSAVSLPFDL